jgi:hypothetical protein
MDQKIVEARDNRLLNNPKGVTLTSSDGAELKISRKDAMNSVLFRYYLSTDIAKENRTGWTVDKYENEPLLQIEFPFQDFSGTILTIVADYLHTVSEGKTAVSEFNNKLLKKIVDGEFSSSDLTMLLKATDRFNFDSLRLALVTILSLTGKINTSDWSVPAR